MATSSHEPVDEARRSRARMPVGRKCLGCFGFLQRAQGWRQARMTVHEELFLNPFEKWARFGRFPTTFFLHAVLVVVVTVQVQFYLDRDIIHACNTATHFSSLFLGTARGSVTLRQPGELQDAVEKTVRNYFSVNDVTFNDVVQASHDSEDDAYTSSKDREEDWSNVPVADYLRVVVHFRNTTRKKMHLTRLGFLQDDKEYLRRHLPSLYNRGVQMIQEIVISFTLLETVHVVPLKGHFVWGIVVRFDGTSVGTFVGSFSYSLGTTGHGWQGPYHYASNVGIMIIALVSVVLILRKFVRSLSVLLELRRKSRHIDCSARSVLQLSWREELALFNWWWLVSVLSHIGQVVASTSCIWRTPDVTNRFSLLGWSCFLTWLNICQYLEFFPGYYVTFSTMGKGMANVCRYMTSVLPILTAFMFLGTCHFWQAASFQGITESYTSLFSLLNGDMVHDAFVDVGKVAGWPGHLYLYVFIFFFIYIILNVNITIIEEAFFSAHFEGLKHEEQMARARNLLSPLEDSQRAWNPVSPDGSESNSMERQDALESPGGSTLSPLRSEQGPGKSKRAFLESLKVRTANDGDSDISLLMKGNMSPRILENPRLQGALAAVYPDTRQSRTPQRGIHKRAMSWSDFRSAHPDLTQPILEEHVSFKTAEETSADFGSPNANAGESALGTGGANPVDWWLTTIPQWTRLLRSMPLPRRSEANCVKDGWSQLERLLAEHSGAVTNVSAALYRENSRC